MKKHIRLTFLGLLNKYEIEIPQIQRDYVQGKEDKSQKVDAFIEDLCDACKGEKKDPIILNFIYGYIDGNKFIPIDGQQRLTALFLLHLYLISKASVLSVYKDKLEKFKYDTRYSTPRFFYKIIENLEGELNNLNSKEKLSEKIKSKSWFSPAWNNDQSILSSLAVLDKINDNFVGVQVDYKKIIERLDNNTNCPISFMFLEMDNYYNSSDLYIKLNARGKQLTPLENFKASLLSYVEKISLSLGEDLKDLAKKFSEDIDGESYSIIWGIIKSLKSKETNASELAEDTDQFILQIIKNLLLNRVCCLYEESEEKKDELRKKKLLEKLKSGENSTVLYFEDILSLLPDSEKKQEKEKEFITTFFNDFENVFLVNKMIRQGNMFLNITKSEFNQYPKRIILFATQLLKYSEDYKEKIKGTLRIIENLATNTQIDDEKEFLNLINALYKFSRENALIMLYETPSELKDSELLTRFRKEIRFEEYMKQGIINISEEKCEIINEIEKINSDYFRKEIGFLLWFYFINEKQKENQELNVDTFEESNVIELFKDKSKKDIEAYIHKFERIIDLLTDDKLDSLIRQLFMLYFDGNFEDFGKRKNSGIYNFYRKSETHNNDNWRGFFRKPTDKEELEKYIRKGKMINSIINDEKSKKLFADVNNIEKRDILEEIICEKREEIFSHNQEIVSSSELYFLTDPKSTVGEKRFFWDFSWCNYLCKLENEWYLMKGAQRKSLIEIHLHWIYINLPNEKLKEETISSTEYWNDKRCKIINTKKNKEIRFGKNEFSLICSGKEQEIVDIDTTKTIDIIEKIKEFIK